MKASSQGSRVRMRPRPRVITRTSHYIRQNALGLVAIFIALSGTAWAAGKIGASEIQKNAVHTKHIVKKGIGPSDIAPDAVRSKHIKNGEVKGGDVLNGSLTGVDIADGSVLGTDIANGSVARVDLAANARGPAGFAGFKDDTGLMCNDWCTLGSVAVPAGSYAVFGKILITPKGSSDIHNPQVELFTQCRLVAGANSDNVRLWQSGRELGGSLSMQVVTTFDSPGAAEIECTDFGFDEAAAKGSQLKITAIELGSLGNVGL